jgi:hypothetical protein
VPRQSVASAAGRDTAANPPHALPDENGDQGHRQRADQIDTDCGTGIGGTARQIADETRRIVM